MPLVLCRIYEEDIKFENTSKNIPKFQVSPSAMQREQLAESERLMANLNEFTSHRHDAQRRSINLTASFEGTQVKPSDPSAIERRLDAEVPLDEVAQGRPASTSLLYRRNTVTETTWDDFELLSIIGRGTFGKVYLVKNKLSDKYYAMKCIRKDVVIQHESVESL